MNYKKFGILFISSFVIIVLGIISFTAYIDPYFHYHAPLNSFKYIINNERYQNDGIVKNFDYDAIITGTSMTQNFKTTELDKLFDVNSIKVPLSGATYREVSDLLNSALQNNKNVKIVIQSLDYYYFYMDKDQYRYDSYPTYLYNDTIMDDISYVLNKESFIDSLITLGNKKATTFDDYGFWGNNRKYGKNIVDALYERPKKVEMMGLDKSDIKILTDSINQNIISLIKKYPNIKFYLFYPPYSIYEWDYYMQTGELNKILYGEKLITEMLLEYDNVHLFSFLNNYDMITDLNNYKDTRHYSPQINSMILKSMKNGEYELTKDNYESYYEKVIPYYQNFQYDDLFE